jgi:ABC-type phosphate/phosphonate transport system ATPase subunit
MYRLCLPSPLSAWEETVPERRDVWRCLPGSTRVSAGVIRFARQDLTALHGIALRLHQARVGMIFQQFHLVRQLRVLDNVLIVRLLTYTFGAIRWLRQG